MKVTVMTIIRMVVVVDVDVDVDVVTKNDWMTTHRSPRTEWRR